MEKLDISIFDNGIKKVKIGELRQEVIDAFQLNRKPCDIILWYDRIKYVEKHKKDFKSENDYYKHIEQIPNIIQNPDYIGLHPKDNSLQYIKRIDKIMLLGVRIKAKGDIFFRSTYPISESNLRKYLNSGTLIEYDKTII